MKQRNLGGIDYFKFIAALLVVAIHTSPLSSFSTDADFIFTRVLARTAVPFFLMVTGYFLLTQYLFEKSMDIRPLCRFLKKISLLYGVAIVIYLPINIYAGHFQGVSIADFLRVFLFDGTFYHLWYLPASMIGVLIIYSIGYKLPFSFLVIVCSTLYLIGLFGDSYYGFIDNSSVGILYDAIFRVSSYTRNGVFYAPIFLLMGAWINIYKQKSKTAIFVIGFSVSILLMALEGLSLHYLGVQRHDSMYILLLPCMYFLFQLIIAWNKAPSVQLRKISTWIYLLHPLMIIAVRGIAKIMHLEMLLVENSLIHYIAVCFLAVIVSLILERLFHMFQTQENNTGRAWIELSKTNLYKNIDELSRLLPVGCKLMPAVKANAYGHGAVIITKALADKGIKSFCVASIMEGIELRKNGITGEILILGYTHPSHFTLLIKYCLIQTVIDYSYAMQLNSYGKKIRVHLKIDTGMHRLGERPEQIDKICNIFNLQNLVIEGVYTHLCVSDGSSTDDKDFTQKQATSFYEVLKMLDERGLEYHKAHLLASYGLLNYPELCGDYARVGIALYGVLSNRQDEVRCPIHLYPVLSIKARISIVKELFKGEGAGYGLHFIAKENKRIAVLSIGYADGIPRSLSCGVGKVLINGKFAPIIGNICMDQTLVDITNIPDVKQGDIAVIIGMSGDNEIKVYDLAEQSGTITNEILSRLGARLERKLL